jgi:hypothetical protein
VSPLLIEASPVPTAVSPLAPDIAESPLPEELVEPEAGMASIGGTLFTYVSEAPIPGTLFYLTPAMGESDLPPGVYVGPQEENGDVSGMSDINGRFVLNNVPEGKYYLAVWAPYNWILAVESAGSSSPRLFTLRSGQQEDLGLVYLSWP